MLVINEVQAEGHPTQHETDCTSACILLNTMDDVCASACGNKNKKLDYFYRFVCRIQLKNPHAKL